MLRYKVKTIGCKALEKIGEDIEKPKLHHNEMSVMEDELKPELDVLSSLAKTVSATKESLGKISEENRNLAELVEIQKAELIGEKEFRKFHNSV